MSTVITVPITQGIFFYYSMALFEHFFNTINYNTIKKYPTCTTQYNVRSGQKQQTNKCYLTLDHALSLFDLNVLINICSLDF